MLKINGRLVIYHLNVIFKKLIDCQVKRKVNETKKGTYYVLQVCVCLCVCASVRSSRERVKERKKEREKDREKERERDERQTDKAGD